MPPEPAHPPLGRRPLRILIGVAALMLMIGCAPAGLLKPLPAPLAPEDSAAVLERVAGINHGLRAFKGIGRLEIETLERRQTARVAWVASLPDRLRLDLLGAGLPVVSFASDGRRIYLRRHADGDLQSRSVSNSGLQGFLGLPLAVNDVLCAMVGRLPDLACERISVHADAATDGLLLIFHRSFGSPLAQVRLDAVGEQLRQVERYRFDGSLHYRIEYRDHRMVNGYRLPHRVEIQDARTLCRVQVERWWTDVSPGDSAFVLKAADG